MLYARGELGISIPPLRSIFICSAILWVSQPSYPNCKSRCPTDAEYCDTDQFRTQSNTSNATNIYKVDRDQLAQLKSLEKRLRAEGGDHHRLDFALPDPQVCVDDLFGRLYPKRERGGSTPSLQGLKRDVRKALAHDQYTDVDMVNAHPVILSQLF